MTRKSWTVLIALVATSFLSVPLVSAGFASAQSQQNIQQNNGVTAAGPIANNQMEDGKVSWIQAGIWRIRIMPQDDPTSGAFSATFTMVKPDGTSMHKHSVKNFTSSTVAIEGGELVMIGTADIYSDNMLKYSQAPVTVHIMGKTILGLAIDSQKTEGHFASSEMYGIMTRPGGLGKLLEESSMGMESDMDMDHMTSSSSKMTEFSNIKVTSITDDSAMVEGTTSTPVMCKVEYGKDSANMDKTATDSTMMMNSVHRNHSVMLENLEPNTTYSYRFMATVNGETVYSDMMTFTTLKA